MTINHLIVSAALMIFAFEAKAQSVFVSQNLFSDGATIEQSAYVLQNVNGSQLDVDSIYIGGNENISILNANQYISLGDFNSFTFFDGKPSVFYGNAVVKIEEDVYFNVIAPNSHVKVSEGVTVFGSIYSKNLTLGEHSKVVDGAPYCQVPEPSAAILSLGAITGLLFKRRR